MAAIYATRRVPILEPAHFVIGNNEITGLLVNRTHVTGRSMPAGFGLIY